MMRSAIPLPAAKSAAGLPALPALPAPTAAKTMAVFEAVGRSPAGLTQAELVQQTGCSANLVFRVLSTLVTLGYLNRQEDGRRYVLTSRLLEICQPRAADKSLAICAHPAMQALRDQSRETVQLMIRAGNKGLVLEQLGGLEPVQVMGRVGMQIPLYSCAPGKAILAALPAADWEPWLASTELKAFTAHTRATPASLLDDLNQTRRRGYAEDWEEGIEGIRCAAAAILDAYDRPIAAVTVMAPVKRLPKRRFPELGQWCRNAAARIRQELLS